MDTRKVCSACAKHLADLYPQIEVVGPDFPAYRAALDASAD